MPYNGSGVFSPSAADFPAVSGTLIQSSKFNNVINDIATGLSTAIAKDGQTTVTANLPMAGFKHTGVGNASARDQYASADQVQDGDLLYGGVAGGTADALTITTAPSFSAYVTGMTLLFKAGASPNTGAATLQVNGIAGPKTIQNDGVALEAGEIAANKWYRAVYDGTNFQLYRISAFERASFLARSNAWSNINTFIDTNFQILGSSDATKKLRFEVDGFTTASTRIATPPDYNFRVMSQTRGSNIASAATLDLDAATGDYVAVTGSTTITAITLADGKMMTVRAAAGATFTYQNGVDLVLPTGQDITVVAGDVAIFRGESAGTVRCVAYMRANGVALANANGTTLTLGTEQATTSGTSKDFTSIPSWVNRITLQLVGVSTDGTSDLYVQLGDSGGIEVTGYNWAACRVSGGSASAAYTAAFAIATAVAAASVFYGKIIITRESGNTWSAMSVVSRPGVPDVLIGAGTKTLSATLDRIRLTTAGGDTFDLGAANILYE